MKRITVRISQPCHERWNAMQPTEQGRFCASCQKTVVDYTALSDRELIRRLNQASGGICGRFRSEQLNRSLTLPTQVANPVWYRWLGVLTLGLLGWQTAQAGQAEVKIKLTTTLPNQLFTGRASRDTMAPSDSGRFFAGTVVGIDSMGKPYPVPGANVVVKGTTLGTQTDRAGLFRLAIPADLQTGPLTLVFSSIGFMNQEISYAAFSKEVRVMMQEDTDMLGEIIHVGEYKISSKPSRWQRLKRKFFHKAG